MLILTGLSLAGPWCLAQEADLVASARWVPACSPCAPGDVLTMVNTVTNLGPDTAFGVVVLLATPMPGTSVLPDSWTTTHGGFEIGPDGSPLNCSPYSPACGLTAVLGPMEEGSTATLTYGVMLDPTAPPKWNLRINHPPDLAQELDGQSLGWPSEEEGYYGPWSIPSWYTWDVIGGAQWVDDGTGEYGEYGCFPLQGFTPGKVAMVFRGPLYPGTSCEFSVKAWNAQQAGAIGVLIVDHGAGVASMGAGEHGPDVVVPTLLIPMAIGHALYERLAVGETVDVTFPGYMAIAPGDPWEISGEETGYPEVWALGYGDPDCCPQGDPGFPGCCSLPLTDNLVFTRVVVDPFVLFTDGFESGDSSAWDFTLP